MFGSRRNQIVTDQPVQGELLFRAIIYWCFCMVMLEISVLSWLFIFEPSLTYLQLARRSLELNAPAFCCSIFLLPLILYDLLRVSSRFAGPVQSVRLTLRQLAEGKPARRVYLRRDDFWQDLAHYANVVADRVEADTNESPKNGANCQVPSESLNSSGEDPLQGKAPATVAEELVEI